MNAKLRPPRLTYSNVIATIALFIALGGAAVAAGLPKNSVGPRQIKRGAVNAAKLKRNAVRPGKIAKKAVVAGKIAPGAVLPGNIVNGGVNTNKLASNAVRARNIKNNVVTTNKLSGNAVTNGKLAPNSVGAGNLMANSVRSGDLIDGSVTLGKLAADVPPLLGSLRGGQTLRGVFDVGGSDGAGDVARGAVSYQFPIAGSPPVPTVLEEGEATAACPGIGSGSAPSATPGNLCVYLTDAVNLEGTGGLLAENNTRLGFGLVAKAKEAGEYHGFGQWAVTAP